LTLKIRLCLRSKSGQINYPYSRRLAVVDSVVHSVEKRRWLERELLMADENNTGPIVAAVGTHTELKTSAAKTQRSPRRQKTAAEPLRAVSKSTAAKLPNAKPRRYSEQERIEKLKGIETQVTEAKGTLKDAIKGAGISEQTYYQWKRSVKPVDQREEKLLSAGDELADLVQLEAENQRLRKRLAEKLRAENTELRKRLGLG
jgi:putative transposase